MSARLLPIIRLTLLEARRTRLLWFAVLVVAVGVGVALFLDSIAITEAREIRVGALAAGLRLAAMLLVSLFVIGSTLREFDDKVVDLLLSLPLPRAVYLLGKLAGFVVFAALVSGLFMVPLLFMAEPFGVVLWGGALVAELAIVAALALFCLLTFQNLSVALSVVVAFYLLARSMGAIQLMARGTFYDPGSLFHVASAWAVDGVAFLLPELYRFGPAEWLMYGTADAGALLPVVGQTLIYVALLVAAALFDLYRREF
ncbi:MAG: ABC transporter permease [Gammaproteobacteria bacterium]|nr:ABC transporter permease [Gammaproteobacteria bacterium]